MKRPEPVHVIKQRREGLLRSLVDGVPYIGPSAVHPGLWHVFGFCGHGFQLAPAVGEAVAKSLVTGKVESTLLPFATDRFADRLPNLRKALA